MELYQLKYFEEVANQQSMSQAAEQLHISQPALSKAIAKLESELGVKLFDRVGKRIVLNERGANFREGVVRTLIQANESVNLLKHFDNAYPEAISIGVEGPCEEALACTSAFMTDNPHVHVTFETIKPGSVNNTIKTDFSFSSRTSQASSGGVVYAERTIDIALPENHELANRDYIDLSEMAGEPFIFLTSPYTLYDRCYTLCADNGFTPLLHSTTNCRAALFDFVRNGFGVGLIDGMSNEQDEASYTRGVRIISILNSYPIRKLLFQYRKQESPTPANWRFLEFVFDFFHLPMSKLDQAVID